MITMPYETVVAAIFAAAAMGALGAWVLCGALDENRVLVTRAQRWQSRVSHPAISSPSIMDVLLTRMSRVIELRRNKARVRAALRSSKRLLRQAHRLHVGAHRFDRTTHVVQRRFAGMNAGWLALPAAAVPVSAPPAGAVATGAPVVPVSAVPATTAPVPAMVAAEALESWLADDALLVAAVDAPAMDAVRIENAVMVIETTPKAYRPIRSHRPTANRRPEPRRAATRPQVPRQRASRSSRMLDTAVV